VRGGAGHRAATAATAARCAAAGIDAVGARSRDGGGTLAHVAARREDPGLLAVLVEAGLDPVASNMTGSVFEKSKAEARRRERVCADDARAWVGLGVCVCVSVYIVVCVCVFVYV
jgi:hypothetical protein